MKSGLFQYIISSELRAQQLAQNNGEVNPVTSAANSTVSANVKVEAALQNQKKKKRQRNRKNKQNQTTPVDAQKEVSQVVTEMEPANPPPVVEKGVEPPSAAPAKAVELTREQIMAERKAKKEAKLLAKKNKSTPIDNDGASSATLCAATVSKSDVKQAQLPAVDKENKQANEIEPKKPALTKAERRALQEAQRAAKAASQPQKSSVAKPTTTKPTTQITKSAVKEEPRAAAKVSPLTVTGNDGKVKLFNHLKRANQDATRFANNPLLHPAIARLGEQYAKRTVVGSNARCVAFLNALKMVIQDFETPAKKEFSRSLETTLKYCVKYLQECRPLAVSVSNAYKHIKHVLSQLSADKPESECKEHLCQFIDTYIENQIGKAAEAISESMQEKIKNGDVLVTFGCSSLIYYICEQAKLRNVDFRVIVVDARPFCEGLEMLRRLTAQEIPCSYVLINAVGFIMPEATKVLLGAHALLANGYVMARTGTAQVALVARSYNVPVLVCCETHKFSERFQTDAIVYNELGDPEDLVRDNKCSLNNWQCKGKMTPLNLMYDITPPELVTAVVTDVSILPCTSVPVILRIKPAEIGYFG